jgi:hypothetical protein
MYSSKIAVLPGGGGKSRLFGFSVKYSVGPLRNVIITNDISTSVNKRHCTRTSFLWKSSIVVDCDNDKYYN